MATDLERIEELLDREERAVRLRFLEYVQLVRSPRVIAQVEELLEARDLAGAFRIIESYIARLADVLPIIQQRVGEGAATELAAIIPQLAIALSFDPTNPRAAALVRTHRLALIREFTDGQLRAVQQAINRALNAGAGAQATARAFRDAIGLTATQESAVANYRRMLEQGSREALDRVLRDRRFDQRLLQAVEGERPLTQRQIDLMTQRYRARALAARAETIARTEAGRAVAEARDEALEQVLEATGIPLERIERIWNVTRDARTRDWHRPMQGQARPVGEPFIDGNGNRLIRPHDPAAPAGTTINCRCGLTFRLLPAA